MMAIGAAAAVLVVAAFGGWYFLIRDDAPAAVNLADAVASASEATAVSGLPSTATAEASGTAEAASTATATGTTADPTATALSGADLVGTWTLADGTESFVGYRIAEELARVGAATAVGRTSDVSATLVYDGAAITSVEIEANLKTLRSDDDRRDGQLERQALETNQFPTATFSLTEAIVLESEPAEGVPIAVTAVGELTLHGVTRSVSIPLEGQLVGGRVVVVGSTVITLADYEIDAPTSIAVLSVAEEGTFEFQLVFEHA